MIFIKTKSMVRLGNTEDELKGDDLNGWAGDGLLRHLAQFFVLTSRI